MREKLNQSMEKVTSLFKYCYIIHILLAFNTLLVDKSILKVTSAIVLVLGVVCILYRLVHIKNYLRYPFVILYILFLVLFGVSCLFNIHYGVTENAKIFMWMTFQFGLLYAFDLKKDEGKVKKEFQISMFLIIGITSVMNLISMIMMFVNYCGYCILDDGRSFLIGVAYWGRLYGIHTDPNYGSVLSVVALMAGIYFFLKLKKIWARVLMIVSAVLQALFIIFSASRTGLVATCVCMLFFWFFYSLHRKKKIVRACIVAVVAVVLVAGVNKGVVTGYNYVVTQISKAQEEQSKKPDKKNDKKKEEMVKLGREEELQGDVSNRRFDLWKNAVNMAKTSPVVGVSFGNFIPYAEENLPDCYMISNEFATFNAFHNMFMDLIASQGIVGFVVFIVIMLSSLWYLLKHYKTIPEADKPACAFLFSACAAMLVSSLFVSEILYVNNQVTVLFWTLWGFLIYFVKKGEQKKG